MSTSPRSWRDNVWLTWFCIQIPVITCVDALDKYPAWLYATPDSPLYALQRLRDWYIATHNDPLVQWTPESHAHLSNGGGSFVPLFLWIELAFTLPTVLYVVYRLGLGLKNKKSTTGPLELLLLVYAFETAFTTAVCLHNVGYWDPAVYSNAQKNVFRFQLMGPWFVMPTLMFVDVYSRLLARFKQVDTIKKTQ